MGVHVVPESLPPVPQGTPHPSYPSCASVALDALKRSFDGCTLCFAHTLGLAFLRPPFNRCTLYLLAKDRSHYKGAGKNNINKSWYIGKMRLNTTLVYRSIAARTSEDFEGSQGVVRTMVTRVWKASLVVYPCAGRTAISGHDMCRHQGRRAN